jgi:putative FmdB family regulatory protein
MPTYDYECDACGHTFDVFQTISAAKKRKCPECGKPKLRRLIGAGAAIVFKGSGFYQTDYRSDSYKQKAQAESKASEGKSSESKSESSTGGDASSPAAAPKESSNPSTSKSKSADKKN